MLEYFTLILVCQLVGEFAVTTLDIPFPGPVMGMLLLFLFLVVNGSVPEPLSQLGATLLNNLSLLFVPAGVGVMVHLSILGTDLLPLSVALVASTLLTIAVTGLAMKLLTKGSRPEPSQDGTKGEA